MAEEIKVFGVRLELLLIILLSLILILAVTLVVTIRQMQHISRKYYILMSGRKGRDLEGIMMERFREMDQLKVQGHRALAEHQTFQGQLNAAVTRTGIVKYDALEEMAGKLSFALAMLNEENSGTVINVVHSREGCYTYAKEIVQGTSLTPLCQEEREAIQKAIDSADERTKQMAAARQMAEKEAQEMELETFFKWDEEETRRRMQKASAVARRQMREAAGELPEDEDEKPVRKKKPAVRRKVKETDTETVARRRTVREREETGQEGHRRKPANAVQGSVKSDKGVRRVKKKPNANSAGNTNAGYENAGNTNAGYENAGNTNAGYENAGYINAGNTSERNTNAGNRKLSSNSAARLRTMRSRNEQEEE